MQKSIRSMVASDRFIAEQDPFREIILKGAVEAYQHGGLPVYADAVALCRVKDLVRAVSFTWNITIWQGDKDNVWTVNTSSYLASRYSSKAKLHIITESGHLLYLSHWNEILKNL